MEDIAAAYNNIKIPEDKPETKEPSKGLLSSTKRMNVTDKMDKQEPKDRVQQYVGEIRKKKNGTKKMFEFDAPIAGMSLTSELGGRPWQKPAKNNEVEDAINEFIPQLTNQRFIEELLDVLESGVPIMSIANSMQIGGVIKGLHTIDVGILMLPVLVELLSYIADEAGIEYELGTKKKVDSDEISPAKIAALLAKHNKKSKTPDVEEDMGVEEIMEDTVDEPTGLMARR